MNERKLLVNALDGCIHKSTIKLEIADEKNLQYHNDSTTKLARTGSAWDAWYDRDVEDPCPWVVLWNSLKVSTILMLLTAV